MLLGSSWMYINFFLASPLHAQFKRVYSTFICHSIWKNACWIVCYICSKWKWATPGHCFWHILWMSMLLKETLLGLRQFLTTENLKNDEKRLLFHVKAHFVLEVFTFSSWLFGYVEKWLDNEAMVNFKIYDVSDWRTNKQVNTHISQYLTK